MHCRRFRQSSPVQAPPSLESPIKRPDVTAKVSRFPTYVGAIVTILAVTAVGAIVAICAAPAIGALSDGGILCQHMGHKNCRRGYF